MESVDSVLLAAGALLVVSVLASGVTSRFNVPALLVFLVLGMLAGSEGAGGIAFDDPAAAQLLGIVSLVLILFSGGLHTVWRDVRSSASAAVVLSTVGVVITAMLVAAFVHWALGFALHLALLVGAIVASTDAAAVFTVLGARGVRLRGKLTPLLGLESGSNDPMAVFLTVVMTRLAMGGDVRLPEIVPLFAQQMAVGAIGGWLGGWLAVNVLNRVPLDHDGLYPALTTGMALLLYAFTAKIGGNGFLAVYLAGLYVGQRQFIHKVSLMRFHDGLAWLTQIAMFLALGLLVSPSRLAPVAVSGVLLALFLMLVARPVSVFICLHFSDFTWRERALVSWVGLRGAVPIILATFPLLAGVPAAESIFDLVFFAVLLSVLLQGTTLLPVARALGVSEPVPERRDGDALIGAIDGGPGLLTVRTASPVDGRRVVELGFPRTALVALVRRGRRFILPRGSLRLQAGDRVLVIADAATMGRIRRAFTDEGDPRDPAEILEQHDH